MPGWQDVLQDIAGGASGIVSGLTKGAAPFEAWGKVQSQDLANDKSSILLEDLRQLQDARNADEKFYGNAIGAEDSGNRKKTAANEFDIFGNKRQLDLQAYLSDPNGAFQQGIKETGWEPGSPEYRAWLAEAIQQFNPEAGVKAYDNFGVEKIENRNLNEQAALQFIQAYAQKLDPDAVVTRKPDGTVVIMSKGEEHVISGDVLVKVAAMITDKTPADAISKGLKDEDAIQKLNIELIKAMRTGQITPSAALAQLKSQQVALNQIYRGALSELTSLQNSADFKNQDPETLVRAQELRARIDSTKKQMDAQMEIATRIATTSSLPRLGMGGGPPAAAPGYGASSVNAPQFSGARPPQGSMAARAAGVSPGGGPGVSAGAPWGASSEGPPYPTPGGANNPRYDTPQGASGKISSLDQVLQLLQQFGTA